MGKSIHAYCAHFYTSPFLGLLLSRVYWARKTFGLTKHCSSMFIGCAMEVITSAHKPHFHLFLSKIISPKPQKKLFRFNP